jgi:Glycosyl transferase family 2
MLPYFFRHYDDFIDRYFIADNGSQDGSLDLLRSHPRVVLSEFTVEGPSFVLAAKAHYDECWKQSRGQADWVVVCNVDEHLYHPGMRDYLSTLSSRVSLIVPMGYEMVSDTFPASPSPLYKQVRTGVRRLLNDKPQMFSPDLIREIHFHPGRHGADPLGHVQMPPTREVKLLHYKYLGLDFYSNRLTKLRSGLREQDISSGWGRKYSWDYDQKLAHFHEIRRTATTIV